MFATLESVQLLEESDRLAAMILESDIAEEYRTCLNKLHEDLEAQQLIRDFTLVKEKYEEVQRFGRYHPDYTKITKEIREVKRAVDLNDHVANFKRAENDLQSLLDEISVLIGRSVSQYVKVPTGNPFFDGGSSCGGGCGSGGSCGCS